MTTYLKNTWYVAAWAAEVGDTLLARQFLDEPIVMFRDQAGRAVALHDRCPHRFAPLRLGALVGDRVRCGYHGLEFNSLGECVHNPHGNGAVARAAKVRAFPLAERHSLVWIWMGEPAQADTALIPNFSFLD